MINPEDRSRAFNFALFAQETFGKIIGFVINYLKFVYYLVCSILSLLNFFQKNYFFKFLNLFFRSIGRFLGPFIFKRIQFYKK